MNARDSKTSGGLLPAKRRELIAERLRTLGSVHVAALEQEFGISSMTARRDLQLLERAGRAERTHGGAIAPGPPRREDPFRARLGQDIEAKERLALAADELVADGETVFVDASTTAYLAIRSLLAAGRRISLITNSVPVMDLVASSDVPGTTAIGIAGALRKATRSFVGADAIEAIAGHFADKLVFSVQGLAGGVLYDADPLEREVKRAMIGQARQRLLLVDASKLSRRGGHDIGPLSDVSIAVVDGASPADLRQLEARGVAVRSTDGAEVGA